MKKALAVASSDWHLEYNAWARYPDISGDAYFSLKQIVDYCIQYNVPLIGAGDLFDKLYPDSRSVWVAMQEMSRMEQHHLPVYFTEGQHEKAKDKPWLGLHPWPTYTHGRTLSIGAYTLAGLNYTKPHELEKALEIAIDVDIFMCHQVWRNFMGSYVETDGKLEQIAMSGGLIVTGDYHQHVQLAVEPQVKGKPNTVLSPGSTCLQSIDEPPQKFVYLLYDDLSYESLPLRTRRVFCHELIRPDDLEDFIGSVDHGWLEPDRDVPGYIAKPILVIRFNTDIPDLYARVVEAVDNSRAHLFMRPIAKDKDVREVIAGPVEETIELGLEGNLAKLCKSDSWTYLIAKRLLLSDCPEQELQKLQNEFLLLKDQ